MTGKTIDILLFEGVEVMDFAAPFEVFTIAGTKIAPGSLEVRTVASRAEVACRNGLVVRSAALCDSVGPPDIVVLPGGPGVESAIDSDHSAMAYIRRVTGKSDWVVAVCSGSLFLASTGSLRGLRASAHRSDLAALRRLDPTIEISHGERYVKDGRVLTSDGITAAIDVSLFLVNEILGFDIAHKTADWLEYESNGWKPH